MARVGRVRVVWRRLAPGNAIAGPRPSGRVATVGGAARRDRRGPRPPGCVSARWGHRRCLHPHGPGTLGPSGRKRRGRRAVYSPGGGIDIVYTPGPGNMPARRGGWGRPGFGPGGRNRPGGGLARWVEFSPLFAWFAGIGWVLGRVLLPFLARPVVGSAPGRSGPCRAGPRARRVGCGVSGRLVRRWCRSGRCAGGTRGRGWTARWW